MTLVSAEPVSGDEQASRPEPRHRPSGRRRRRVSAVFVAGLLFFLSPTLALVAGVRAGEIENRRLAEFPSLSAGWSFLSGVDRWATDHLSLRDVAVRANTDLSERVFREVPDYGSRRDDAPPGFLAGDPALVAARPATPSGPPAGGNSEVSPQSGERESDGREAGGPTGYPAVVQGKNGWLYFGDDVNLACRPALELDAIFEGWRRLISIVEGSGRRVLVTIAPDKSTIVPAYLPDTYVGQKCSTRRRGELWDRLRAGELGPAYVDLRGPLERQQSADAQPIYWSGDTHWAPRGDTVYAHEVVRRLAPELVSDGDVHNAGSQDKIGELTKMIAREHAETVPAWRIQRPGVSSAWWIQPGSVVTGRHVSTTTGPPLISTRVALIGDSFSYQSMRQLVPYFADLTLVSRKDASFEQKSRAIREADTVVLQVVERRFTTGTSAMIEPDFLDRLARDLQASPRRSR